MLSDFTKYDELPFSVVITDASYKVVYKNSRALIEFSSLRKGSYINRYTSIVEKGEFVREKQIYGVPYFVSARYITVNGTEFVKFIAINNFFNASTRYSAMLFENSTAILSSLEKLEESGMKFVLMKDDVAKVLKRQKRFLRFLRTYEKKEKNVEVGNLSSFFAIIRAKLLELGLDFSFDTAKDVSVETDFYDLAFAVMNVVCFISEYTDSTKVTSTASETRAFATVFFTFEDTRGIVSEYDRVVSANEGCADLFTVFISLFSAFTVLGEGADLSMKSTDGKAEISITFKKSPKTSNPLLTSGRSRLGKYIAVIAKEIFSRK